MNPLSPEHIYPIGVVQRLTALSCRQIRYYEQCGLIKPARTSTNRRMFSQSDVETLLEIRDMINRGYLLEGIKTALLARRREDRGTFPSSFSRPHPS
ncbi:MAG TPA: MerR family transcriptional regulator [Firmicutes bacterium]|nr:MerR family transcriptional regulator [Bacillota bacterium]